MLHWSINSSTVYGDVCSTGVTVRCRCVCPRWRKTM